nr:alpha/beta fold hydrolase [Nakamurella flavida]
MLALIGGPMDARGFAALADELARDHRVLTTDPRGVLRSPVDDPEQERFPELRAADLARLVRHVGAAGATGDSGVAVLGTCGGAVAALALALAQPDLLGTVVAHEPPLPELLPDRAERRIATEETVRHSLERGISDASVAVHFAAGRSGGEAVAQDGADEQRFLQHEMLSTTQWVPDVARLRGSGTRIVVGVGEDSAGQTCGLAARALAADLGTGAVEFPGGHLGFVDHPATFADRLRAVLAEG